MISVMYGVSPMDSFPTPEFPDPKFSPADVKRVQDAMAGIQNADPEGDAAIVEATRTKLQARREKILADLAKVDDWRRELQTIERVLAAYAEPEEK